MVRDDREHGSRWLVHETISILYDLATRSTSSPDEGLRKLQDAGRELAQARPAMAAIAGAVGRILSAPGGLEEIGRASWRGRVEISVAAVSLKKTRTPTSLYRSPTAEWT